MLLLHQVGSVKIGEVVRYTVTYTPAHDRIIPSPATLHLKIKNTSAIPLRAAFVHGPYTLYAAAYPASFRPNEKTENPRREGVPEFEPNLKAGGTFTTQLSVPEDVRQTAGTSDRYRPGHGHADVKSVTWIIEVSSQVIFSASALVHYEVLLGRDGHSLQMGFASSFTGGSGQSNPAPGQISDHQQSQGAKDGKHAVQPKGVYSKAISLRVDDTASLWNTPKLPLWNDPMVPTKEKKSLDTQNTTEKESTHISGDNATDAKQEGEHRTKRRKKIHLVVLTHGLHSNLGADMLYLKESIDAAARQARKDARARRRREKENLVVPEDAPEGKGKDGEQNPPPVTSGEYSDEDESDDEEVLVRGFSGNAAKTERGIKYLGKRLAKFVLSMTYPDQPYKPVSKKVAAALPHALKADQTKCGIPSAPSHENSTIIKAPVNDTKLAYQYTKISFIGHSLGGLIQMYAVAYIQKHSPKFFDIIEPINFIAMASPFLGLSNENPLYVKFALDFGLVGRTGQDLGLTWRAPTLARSGWGAIVGNIGESAHKKVDGESKPESKPLLRILPTGPAHIVLKKFRNRTVYSNVVNDGIVPLRTSCLLFLDWSGLDRVEKARRENGLVGTMAGWGWAEITGANSSSPRKIYSAETSDAEDAFVNTPTLEGHGEEVPQPSLLATQDDDGQNLKSIGETSPGGHVPSSKSPITPNSEGPFSSFMKFFQPNPSTKGHDAPPKPSKIYKRSQTLKIGSGGDDVSISDTSTQETSRKSRGKATALNDGEDAEQMSAPPKTTLFEAAGDLLKPPLPSEDFIMDPQNRPRTIFHDRVYHPEDIPPPPYKKRPTPPAVLKKRGSFGPRGMASESSIPSVSHTDSNMSAMDYDDMRNHPDRDPQDVVDSSAMKVEEKIARAYHRDLSWRKVLVRMEPDAHNNMIVRRMFANAYGWPVVKHLCDTHFADSSEANTRDEDEGRQENAKKTDEQVGVHGEEVNPQKPQTLDDTGNTDSENREASDKVPALHPNPTPGGLGLAVGSGRAGRSLSVERRTSETWSESHWADSADDSDDAFETSPRKSPAVDKKPAWNWTEAIVGKGAGIVSPKGTSKEELDQFFAKKDAKPEHDDVKDSEVPGVETPKIVVGLDQLPAGGEELVGGKVDK